MGNADCPSRQKGGKNPQVQIDTLQATSAARIYVVTF